MAQGFGWSLLFDCQDVIKKGLLLLLELGGDATQSEYLPWFIGITSLFLICAKTECKALHVLTKGVCQ